MSRRAMMTAGGGGGSPLIPTEAPLWQYEADANLGHSYTLALPANSSSDRLLMFVSFFFDAVAAGVAPSPAGWTQLATTGFAGIAGGYEVRVFTRAGNGATSVPMTVMSGGFTHTAVVVLRGGAGVVASASAPPRDTPRVSTPITLPKEGTIIPFGGRVTFLAGDGSGFTFPYPEWNQMNIVPENDNSRLCLSDKLPAGTYTPGVYSEAGDVSFVQMYQINVGLHNP